MVETRVKWRGGMEFIGGTNSKQPVIMDASSKFGGKGNAPTPMEVLLITLGGCTGMDVVSILKKMRVGIDAVEIELRGERKENHPRVYRLIEIKYILKGREIAEEKVKRAIELSQEKYCSISAMLRETCKIEYSYEIYE